MKGEDGIAQNKILYPLSTNVSNRDIINVLHLSKSEELCTFSSYSILDILLLLDIYRKKTREENLIT
jgi:hypothetical protein